MKSIHNKYEQQGVIHDVYLLIDLNIRNVEKKLNEAAKEIMNFPSEIVETHSTAEFFKQNKFFSWLEQCTLSIKRLKFIRDNLNLKNVPVAIELLSNDKYIICSEEVITDKMLKIEDMALGEVA